VREAVPDQESIVTLDNGLYKARTLAAHPEWKLAEMRKKL